MSHPPETSRPYNDFLEIFNDYKKMDRKLFGETHGFDIAEAIEAWVREKEALARLQAAQKYGNCCCDAKEGYSCFLHKITIPKLQSALATARKQQETP